MGEKLNRTLQALEGDHEQLLEAEKSKKMYLSLELPERKLLTLILTSETYPGLLTSRTVRE